MPQAGDVVAERFELVALAGEGGMGSVWRARDRTSDGPVALKLIDAGAHADRFAREALVLAELVHPRIVRYLGHGAVDARTLYLAMEWLEGEDLHARLERQGLSIVESVEIARHIAEALGFAHARAIVHRDIKPANVMLAEGAPGGVKVVDFGIARKLRDSPGEITAAGTLVGTVGYMSPEQAQAAGTVDARADVFALGCVLFECVTGRPAFEGSELVAVLLKVLLEEPPALRDVRDDVPAALDALVSRMMAQAPAERPADGDEVARALSALDLTDTAAAVRHAPSARPPAIARRAQKLWSVILARKAMPTKLDVTGTTVASDADVPAVLARVRGAIEPFGARADALADGSLVAVLSESGWAVDLAHRAARCALALRDALPDAPLAMAMGRGDDTGRVPAGEVVERATRLASAGGGHVRVDEVTAGFLDLRFEVIGDERSLQLVREREVVSTARTLLGKETPCLGREREIGTLSAIWDECVAESVARAVLVTAPPGWGKSRVRHELVKKLQARGEPMQLWVAQADEMRRKATFTLLTPTVRRAAAIQDGEPVATRREKLAARVARNVPPKHRQRVAVFLGEMIGVHFDDEGYMPLRSARADGIVMADHIRLAWQDWLEAEASEAPVLLVWEDLHWGDAASVALVDLALRNLRDKPWMVLALARPEVRDEFPELWSERAVVTMALGELTAKTSERYVRAVLGGRVRDEDVRAIVERGAGQPLYLEELVRAAVAGKLSEVPGTVLALVQSRLETLPEEARRVLRGASVIGRTFWSGAVTAMLGGAARTTEVDAWLAELCRREVIARLGESRYAGEQEYAFRHSVMQEAAYGTLMEEDRVLGHRLAARWMAGRAEAEPRAVAEHFVAGAEPGEAIEWFAKAAGAAFEGNDMRGVLAMGERAIECGAQGEARGRVRARQAAAADWLGEPAAMGIHADEARALLQRGGERWIEATRMRLSAAAYAADVTGAIAAARELSDLDADPSVASALAGAMASAASNLRALGARESADAALSRAMAIASAAVAIDDRATARLEQATAARAKFGGDVWGYYEHILRSHAAWTRAGDSHQVLNSGINVDDARVQLGMFDQATASLGIALTEAARLGLTQVVGHAQLNLCLALWGLGRLDEAREHAREGLPSASRRGDLYFEVYARIYLARIELSAEDPAAAERECRTAAVRGAAIAPTRAYALAILARALLAQGRIAEALAAAREAAAIRESLGGLDEGDAFVRLALADALHASGETVAAGEALAAARDALLARAAKIVNEAARASLLENVPEHRDMLARARLWGV
ncbi:MAG: hypothetical protein NVS3B10_05550 [Polyangiales bacterium]